MASNPQPRGRGKRRRKSELDQGLYLRGKTWWFRVTRDGRTVRESTGAPESEIAAARAIRDKRLGEIAERGAGIDRPRDPMLLGEVIALYLREESQPFNRAGAVEQPGTKRSFSSDRGCIVRLFGREAKRNKNGKVIARARKAHLDPNMSAAKFDPEALLALAHKIETETPPPAPSTRRKAHAFLRRVFNWATERPRETGITRSPYSALTREQRPRLFPPVPQREFVFQPEMLRALYDLLPAHALPFVRFAVHTAARLGELIALTWGMVDLEKGIATIPAQLHKTGGKTRKPRTLVLGSVAKEILTRLRPANPAPTDAVFIGRRGAPIRSVRTAFDAAVLAVWTPSKPGEKKPCFHDLRATTATAAAAKGGYAVAQRLLGHSSGGSVTDRYLRATDDAVRRALNEAAAEIDGTAPVTPHGTIPFRARSGQASEKAQNLAAAADSDAASAR